MEYVSPQEKESQVHYEFHGPFLPVDHGPYVREMPFSAQAEVYNLGLPEPSADPELPEFAFSPTRDQRETFLRNVHADFHRQALRFAHRQYAMQGPMAPSKPYQRGHAPLAVTADEKSWLNYQPVLTKNVPEHTKTPVGTAPPLEGLGRFLNRIEEIAAIAKTQMLELPTAQQEFAAQGITAFSLSSSSEDDDSNLFEPSYDIAEHHATRYGTAYTVADLADVLQTIEWERQIRLSSQPKRVWLSTENGAIEPVTVSKTLTRDDLVAMGRRLYRAMGKPTAAELDERRARAEYYGGKIGSGLYDVWTGETPVPQTFDALGAEDQEKDERNGGPQELGLHNVEQGIVQYEPNENEFWPEEFLFMEAVA